MATSPTTLTHSQKLPIKRKSIPSNPTPSPNPQSPVVAAAGDPPFKFHRVWSESDEIRFLQGLLACYSQGLLFPRDLNLFFDTFSESMPQPYTRSQLSEKLRRLRKKFRIVSGRISRGLDPARLAPHDRDLLHLSTRLWHPSYASSSPFSAAEGGGGSGGNKRRRVNPSPHGIVGRNAENSENVMPRTPAQSEVLLPVEAVPFNAVMGGHEGVKVELGDEVVFSEPPGFVMKEEVKLEDCDEVASDEKGDHERVDGLKDETTEFLVKSEKKGIEGLLVKSVLDSFDASVREAEAKISSEGLGVSDDGRTKMERRWQELRIAEMDVVVKRLRLVFENGGQL